MSAFPRFPRAFVLRITFAFVTLHADWYVDRPVIDATDLKGLFDLI